MAGAASTDALAAGQDGAPPPPAIAETPANFERLLHQVSFAAPIARGAGDRL